MFKPDRDADKNCLRQGDIVEAIPFPVLDLKTAFVLGRIQESKIETPFPKLVAVPATHREDASYLVGQVKIRLCFGAVVSHCCELEPRHEKKLLPAAFSVARLIPVKRNILSDPEKLASLKSNRDPRADAPRYLDYFYLGVHPRLGDQEWMVDYCQVVSLPNTEFPAIMQRKVYEMEDRERVKFKIKLATYLGRITDEEDRQGLRTPW